MMRKTKGRTMTLTEKKMYDALLAKDSEYEGLFFAGIKTTGIFCRPTCRARKPKKENVVFFKTAEEALESGYRPCKLCSPLEPLSAPPEWLKPLLDAATEQKDLRFKDDAMKAMGVDPARVRRWFKKHHGMTFQAYVRLMRLGNALDRIKGGDKVIESAFASGYESLSGFTESFKKEFGDAPKKSAVKNVVVISKLLSPLGPLYAGATADGLCLLEFADHTRLPTQIKQLQKLLQATIVVGTNKHIMRAEKELKEYFSGRRNRFDVPLVLTGTDYQKKVWRGLMEIPYGTTRSYGEQAKLLSDPKAVRAVASANGQNRIAIIVPCHRVIGADGKLVGYGGGLHRKQFLLDLELEHAG
jgi:AraC family transcriptional regulator of adaptative response/methylated-DNA-[protein]-cysteine methyltransferase